MENTRTCQHPVNSYIEQLLLHFLLSKCSTLSLVHYKFQKKNFKKCEKKSVENVLIEFLMNEKQSTGQKQFGNYLLFVKLIPPLVIRAFPSKFQLHHTVYS